eukprot:NODE_222_length_2452_cov_34.661257_g173_i0.p1 GENE.NODE_222_length_2452_cov_34.661257_g173_i0~~NODE_222_length_2452_cov_34.661257_g173_i0.p1  ORF type:complete len:734 (+),score=163.77 NODE_222_length_2452_cov_34.661257_g173_i0:162-2363(+)
MGCCPKTMMQCGCCPCCCGDDKEDYDGGFRARDRYCTDIWCLAIFIVFWVGEIIVCYVAASQGNALRLVYGTDYAGNLCGGDLSTSRDSPNPPVPAVFDRWGANWEDRQYLWYPISFETDLQLSETLLLGVCVSSCPNFTIDVSIDNFDPRAPETLAKLEQVSTYHNGSGLPPDFGFPHLQYNVWYTSEPMLRRCIPTLAKDAAKSFSKTIGNKTEELLAVFELNSFANRAYQEAYAAWPAILLALPMAFLLSLIWLFMMRFLTKPIVLGTIIGIFVLLVCGGLACWYRYETLKDEPQSETAQGTDSLPWAKIAQAFAIVLWVLSVIYLFLLVFMFRRIMIAIEIVEEATYLVASTPSLVLIPLATCGCVGILTFFHVYIGMLLKTMASLQEVQTDTANLFDKQAAFSGSYSPEYGYNTDYTNSTAKTKLMELTADDVSQYLQWYNLFAYLWSMGFVSAMGYMIVALVAVLWFWSAPKDSEKMSGPFIVPKAIGWTLRYHLGTLAFGSFIIACIQFVRFLLTRFEKKLREIQVGEKLAKMISRCADCCLACIERVVKFINHRAYIMTAIRGCGFCTSACHALRLIVSNLLRVAAVSMIADWIMIFAKLCIVISTMLVAYCFMHFSSMGDTAVYRVVPMILIGFISFLVSTLFINVCGTVVDTLFIAFLYDEEVNKISGIFYSPDDLKKWMDHHAYEPARPDERDPNEIPRLGKKNRNPKKKQSVGDMNGDPPC